MTEARDFHCSTHVVENLGKKTIPSDHAEVRIVIHKPTNRGHESKRIPSWMSKHPIFCSILQQLHDDHSFSPDPFCAQAEFKVLLHKAKKMTKREPSRQALDYIGANLLITSTALRACRNRHLGTIMRCCEAWKPFNDCFDTLSFDCIDFQRLSQIIASLTCENLEAREAEVSPLPWTQTEKDIALDRWCGQRAWRNKKPVLTSVLLQMKRAIPWRMKMNLEQGLMNTGEPFSKHARKGPRHHQHEEILRFVQQAPDDITWTIDQVEFDDLHASKKDSALGPAGIPFGFHRCAGDLGLKFLFRSCQAVLEGNTISDCFGQK